ncbi:aldehyde oxidase [Anaeramoeba ignava]|uniref:Aldehyde oxidase n=1 Tax=Anaeramoeba ignava TaxID=1746090 RepID=A0A9Q0LQZ5_ANAIG|nr:aldehyde oxidase [Anaeramoeba ignava]|eukprot:Anaeramoba_ignava/c18824_g1_i1.p1 GENE.c18824_g1_i1~~c18824_g1_i1.p1  ORF type:complete len:1365 (+),score=451.05 c18824_g1_i1:26-4120(+)
MLRFIQNLPQKSYLNSIPHFLSKSIIIPTQKNESKTNIRKFTLKSESNETNCVDVFQNKIMEIIGREKTGKEIVFYLNGERKVLKDIDPSQTLLDYLRLNSLTGVKKVCGEGGCGACSVMISHFNTQTQEVENLSYNSCLVPLPFIDGKSITTVEGIGKISTSVHPIQKRIAYTHGTQCGYCTPGFVVNLYTVLANNPNSTVKEIEEALSGNLCRCTGYRPIFDAGKSFSKDYDPNSVGDLVPKENNEKFPFPRTHAPFPDELKNYTKDRKHLMISNDETLWFRPANLKSLLELKSITPDCGEEKCGKIEAQLISGNTKLVSGNTEVGYSKLYKHEKNPLMVSTMDIPEMKKITEKTESVEIGATVTIKDCQKLFEKLIEKLPKEKTAGFKALLNQTKYFANYSIRNIATIGGSIYTADPLSDLYPVLMALDAKINCVSLESKRVIPIREFLVGSNKTRLNKNEIVLSVEIPFSKKGDHIRSYKISKRKEDSQAVVNAGMRVNIDDNNVVTDAFLAYGAVSRTTSHAKKASENLIGKKWNEKLLKETVEILESGDIEVWPKLGMTEYRKLQIPGIFIKFFASVSEELEKKTNGRILDPKIITAGKEFERPTRTAKQEFQETRSPVGIAQAHLAAVQHTTGEATFIGDIPLPFNGLYCALVQSTRAHARIVNIDPKHALNLKGVHAFFSAKDVIGENLNGSIIWDEETFASKEVNFFGQIVGVVVADTQAKADEAAHVISQNVEYEDLPFFQTIEEAIEKKSFLDEPKVMVLGDPDEAFKNSDGIIEGEMRSGHQEHFYFETENCLVIPNQDEITVYAACQNLAKVQEAVARFLGKPKNFVTVKAMRIGGGFGGKQDRPWLLSTAVALAAYKLQRPMRCSLDRTTDITMSGMRHEFLGKYKMGYLNDGTIKAVDFHLYSNGGHTMDLSPAVMDRALWSCDNSYNFPNIRLAGDPCRTNRLSCTAYRGFGVPQAISVCETALEHVAYTLGKDSHFIRNKNLYNKGDTTPTGWKLPDDGARKCWDLLNKKIDFAKKRKEIEKFNQENKFKKRGIAIIPAKSSMGFEADFMNQAGALLEVFSDGSIHLSHSGIEMGQGLSTKMGQIVAEGLNAPLSSIRVGETSTDKVPNTSPTAAVTGQELNGIAVKNAVKVINERLEPLRKEFPHASFAELAKEAYFRKINLCVSGHDCLPPYVYDWKTKKGRQSYYVLWAVTYAEVEIDALTGEFKTLHVEIVQDAGTSMNPAIDIGQVEGGFIQGLGLMTMEEPIWASDGHLRTRNVSTYKIPSYEDIPHKFNISLLKDAPNPFGIHSSKAVGESGLQSANSVFFAIRDAIKAQRKQEGLNDFFPFTAPATAEKIRLTCKTKFN